MIGKMERGFSQRSISADPGCPVTKITTQQAGMSSSDNLAGQRGSFSILQVSWASNFIFRVIQPGTKCCNKPFTVLKRKVPQHVSLHEKTQLPLATYARTAHTGHTHVWGFRHETDPRCLGTTSATFRAAFAITNSLLGKNATPQSQADKADVLPMKMALRKRNKIENVIHSIHAWTYGLYILMMQKMDLTAQKKLLSAVWLLIQITPSKSPKTAAKLVHNDFLRNWFYYMRNNKTVT